MQFSQTSCYFISIMSKYSPQRLTILKRHQPVLLSNCQKLPCTPIQNNSQKYGIYSLLCIFLFSIREDKTVLDRMVASFIPVQTHLHFLLNEILVCYFRSQTFGLCQIFEEYVSYIYVRTCLHSGDETAI
jgi:hypothetical protein